MQCVILAGGLGTRLREETEIKPKPMVEIGGRPILWHIMKGFEGFGIKDFIICAGYKGFMIKEYFDSFAMRMSDTTFTFKLGEISRNYTKSDIPKWSVTVVDTGEETNTGGRIKAVENLITGDFFCTYGDGLSDINLNELVKVANQNRKACAVVTAVRPVSKYGRLIIENSQVVSFVEKPLQEEWISGGFFFFRKDIFKHLNMTSMLEQDVLVQLAKNKLLAAYKHDGFWQSMDTYRELLMLNEIWKSQTPKWSKFWTT